MSPTPGLPWSDPDSDPIANILAFQAIGRGPVITTYCQCSYCRPRQLRYLSIYGPGQQPLAEEQMSPDAARWTPSLAEEENILDEAKALLAGSQAASPVSTS